MTFFLEKIGSVCKLCRIVLFDFKVLLWYERRWQSRGNYGFEKLDKDFWFPCVVESWKEYPSIPEATRANVGDTQIHTFCFESAGEVML